MRSARVVGTVVAGLLGTIGVIILIETFAMSFPFDVDEPPPRGLLLGYAAGGVVALVLSAKALRWANTRITPAREGGARDRDLRSNDR